MRTTSATSRRVMRTIAHRNVDWSAPLFRTSPEIAAKMNKFRAWAANADSMAEKYAAMPAPVDFASAKGKIRDTELVDLLESMYKSASLPAEEHTWDEADQAEKQKLLEDARKSNAEIFQMIDETKERIELMKANRTTRETTVNDIKKLYPEIAAEIEEEINNREWFKDTLNK